MIRVLIVDDDKLTRMGLIASLPWKKYGMEVIGEEGNGIAALEFLKKYQVDLVLSDLEMPLMSGLDFMQKALELYPGLKFAVLTVHSDFGYIQQALRLGAIDYIAKVQFDQENFDSILARLSERMRKEKNSAGGLSADNALQTDELYVLVEEITNGEDSAEQFLLHNDIRQKAGFHELSSGIWFWNYEEYEYGFPREYVGCILMHVTGLAGVNRAEFEKSLYEYKSKKYFWEYSGEKIVLCKTYRELLYREEPIDEDTFKKLKERWLSFQWISEEKLFEKIRFDMKKSNITVSKLYHIMLALENAWNRNFGTMSEAKCELPSEFHSWQELEGWLFEIYHSANGVFQNVQYSNEVVHSVMEARQYMDEHYRLHITGSDLAERFHLSRSYFSLCFGKIVGIPYNEYLRNIRITKAREYLTMTSKSISEIAELVGYEDEKYFSKVFKKVTNMNPGEYRRIQKTQ